MSCNVHVLHVLPFILPFSFPLCLPISLSFSLDSLPNTQGCKAVFRLTISGRLAWAFATQFTSIRGRSKQVYPYCVSFCNTDTATYYIYICTVSTYMCTCFILKLSLTHTLTLYHTELEKKLRARADREHLVQKNILPGNPPPPTWF